MCQNLKEITLPSKIISIGEDAFSYCKIEEMILPSSLKYLGESAFLHCKHLIKVVIPSGIKTINKDTFCGCNKLKNVIIPSSVVSIDDFAFSSCSELEEIILPNSVKYLGRCFAGSCSSLKKIIFPSSLKKMNGICFEFCSSLTEFIIPPIVKIIDKGAFTQCTSLTKVEIPSSVKRIKSYAFKNCTSLQTITIPPSVTEIEDCTFCNCSSLVEINIPPSVKSIGFDSFLECKSLVSITIPPTLKSIGFNAFRKCPLEKIIISKPISKKHKITIMTNQGDSICFRALILGSTCVGKTNILLRYTKNTFDYGTLATIGVDFQNKFIDIDGNKVKLQIWDTAGIEKCRTVTKAYYPYTQIFVVVFDYTQRNSLKDAEDFLKEIVENYQSYSTVLLGNKSDLDPYITDQEVEEVETKYNTKLFKVSAKDNLGIKEAFKYVATQAVAFIMNEKAKLEEIINKNYESNSDEEQKKCSIS